MKNFFISLAFLAFSTTACRTLHSYTTIKPNDSFILGNNEHGKVKVTLRNDSKNDVVMHMAPITGGTHTYQTVKPKQMAQVDVAANTALVIANNSSDTANVNLKVIGDIGLSMGYKN